MVSALFDSNIVIDFLNGRPEAIKEINAYDAPTISVITWIEVLAGAKVETTAAVRLFLSNFDLVPLSQVVAEDAMAIRRDTTLKLPDAVIWASARVTGLLFVTRDLKGFSAETPGVRIPYRLS